MRTRDCSMLDRAELMAKAAAWMQARGWKVRLAKKRAYEQSLFEHSLIEVDVLLALLSILGDARHYGLSAAEQRILAVAVLAHDVGKETDAWQYYIHSPSTAPYVAHIIPELTRQVVPELCSLLGFEECSEPVQQIMARCAEFHHSKPGRSDGAILETMLPSVGEARPASGGSDRFLALAHLVKAIDHCCSAASPSEAMAALVDDPALGHHLAVASHEVMLRGVSTTLLHRAAQTAFQERGWRPLIYFSNGTVYAADPNLGPLEATADDIRTALKAAIDSTIGQDLSGLMVGSPTGNILPKPDLVSFAQSRRYLQAAGAKIGAQSFAKKPMAARRKVVEDYRRLKGEEGIAEDDEVERQAGRISVGQPEMMVFKFFKAITDPDKIAEVGDEGAEIARRSYEERFGKGSWAALQSTSTLMPAKDRVRTVDCFWALSGESVGRPEVATVAELPDEARLELLIELLDDIAQRVFAGRQSPRDRLSEAMARAFITDLVVPSAAVDAKSEANRQLEHYAHSKPFAGRESGKGTYLCPICNAPFSAPAGVKASADFIDNPQTHTNRGVAHGPFGYVMVCTACYYERLLLQILLGSRPAEMITLLPRVNLGPTRGASLVQAVRMWVETAQAQMRGETGDLESGFSLAFTDQAARKLGNRDASMLTPEDLMGLFSYRFTADTQKKRRREALKRLKEEFDDDLGALNAACAASFDSWEAVVDALVEDRIQQQECRAIRREVFRLFESVHLICQTPNLIFIPLTYPVAAGSDESDTSKGLRRLYVSLLLSLTFDAAVAIHKEGEAVDFRPSGGAAYVSPVPAVRALVGYEWVPSDAAAGVLAAIGAASLLARDSGLPARSALYKILAADPPERLARRIEEAGERPLMPRHVSLIERLVAFHRDQAREMRQ